MILVDSSVWINHIRNIQTAGVRKLRTIELREELAVGDLILAEVLQGARSEIEAARLEAALRTFPVLAMVDVALAVQSARNYRALRARGIMVRRTIDMLIATFCIEGGHLLLHDDRDFVPMVEHLGLGVL